MANENIEDIKYVRPTSLTLISLFLFFGAFITVWYFLRGTFGSSILNTILFIVSGIVFLVCGIGFWLMKKWVFYLFAAYSLINQVVLLVLGRWNLVGFLIVAIIVYFGYRYRSEMS